MPVRKVTFVPGEFYHLYNRGNSRQEIFLSNQDHQRFVDLLYVANGSSSLDLRSIKPDDLYTYERGERQVAIGAYCLMPNHFHLLVTPLVDDGVTTFMRKLTTGYSMYFNKKHFRTGSLFEGRYKSEHASEDTYLKYLFSYIHLNPVKLIQSDWREKGIQDREYAMTYLQNFQYSSYIDTQRDRPQAVILDRAHFPEYFSDKTDFETELLEWLNFTKARPS
jgi:putative transposase